MRARIMVLVVLLAWSLPAPAVFDSGHAPFRVEFAGKAVDLRVLAFSALPGETLDLRIPVAERAGGPVAVRASSGTLAAVDAWHWRWTAPGEPGDATLEVLRGGNVGVTLNVFTLVPIERARSGYLDGYRIGHYPAHAFRGNPLYKPPSGFIRVTPENQSTPVSPNFTLAEFLCKQQPDHWPKYVVLRPELPVKLEVILAEVNRRGIETATFTIMSGYRTPWYNEAIGNGRYSRHVWGGAADIFIDTSGDGRMDDLVGDGRSSLEDARILHDIVDDLFGRPRLRRLEGGLGLYGPRPHRGPFVHVDARGEPARWALP